MKFIALGLLMFIQAGQPQKPTSSHVIGKCEQYKCTLSPRKGDVSYTTGSFPSDMCPADQRTVFPSERELARASERLSAAFASKHKIVYVRGAEIQCIPDSIESLKSRSSRMNHK
jgi:hypothetical protein